MIFENHFSDYADAKEESKMELFWSLFEKLFENDLKFPKFSWINLENEIKRGIESKGKREWLIMLFGGPYMLVGSVGILTIEVFIFRYLCNTVLGRESIIFFVVIIFLILTLIWWFIGKGIYRIVRKVYVYRHEGRFKSNHDKE